MGLPDAGLMEGSGSLGLHSSLLSMAVREACRVPRGDEGSFQRSKHHQAGSVRWRNITCMESRRHSVEGAREARGAGRPRPTMTLCTERLGGWRPLPKGLKRESRTTVQE